jgi:hypothetical protein
MFDSPDSIDVLVFFERTEMEAVLAVYPNAKYPGKGLVLINLAEIDVAYDIGDGCTLLVTKSGNEVPVVENFTKIKMDIAEVQSPAQFRAMMDYRR